MLNLPRRTFLHLAASAAALPAASRIALAETFPARPVHIVAPYPPGAAPDVVARLIAQPLQDRLGQAVVIDNRPGAAGNVGTEKAAKSPPDGYTLLIAVSTNTINQTLYSNLDFDFRNDFAPVAGVARVAFAIVVNPNFPAKTIPDLIAYAKAHPGDVNMATNGVGTGSHVTGELFMMMTGTKLTHVPYKGNYLTDLISGQVPLAVSPVPAVAEFVKNGQVRGLGVSTAKRTSALPDVPAIGEFVPGYVSDGWYGLTVPKATPAAVIATLEAATRASVADPALQSRMQPLGLEPAPMSSAEFGKFMADEIDKWAKVIKFANIKVD
jgi:tripartite-type tricarboxylate transporter receptor subunit TctC